MTTTLVSPEDAYEALGNGPTAAFGVVAGGIDMTAEVVGPLKPRHVYYGHVWTESGLRPRVFFNFNKYRSDLPPWRDVTEFVLASQVDGEVREYSFTDLVSEQGVQITGDLKTVSLSCEYVYDGIEQCDTISREEVAQ